MSQESLRFGRLYNVSDATRAMYRKLDDAVEAVGILTAAGACGIDRADLRRAIDRDRGRRVAVEHAMAIAAVAEVSTGEKIASLFVAPLGLVVADPRPPMTDKERADRAEAACRSLGPLGEEALARSMGRR